jgi:hypothetical protein
MFAITEIDNLVFPEKSFLYPCDTEFGLLKPSAKRQRATTHLTEFRRLLAFLSTEGLVLLENCLNERPSFDLAREVRSKIDEYMSNPTVTCGSSPFDDVLDRLEREATHRVGCFEVCERSILLDQLLWIDGLNRSRCSFVSCKDPHLHHLCSLLVDPILGDNPEQVSLLVQPHKRESLISMLLKSVVHPNSPSSKVSSDIFLASVRPLTLFVSYEQPRLPGNVAHLIRPLLEPFCSRNIETINCQLLDGLCRVADVLPFLFNLQLVCQKVVDMLEHFVDPEHALCVHPKKLELFIRLLRILTFAARSFDCSPHLQVFCDNSSKFLSSCDDEAARSDVLELVVCFLSCCPKSSVLSYLYNTDEHAQSLFVRLKVYAPRCSLWTDNSLPAEVRKMSSFYRNTEFSDVCIECVDTASHEKRCYDTNKVILRLRCPYFDHMFSSQMVEATARTIVLEGVDVEAFDVAFQHIHGIDDALASDDWGLLLRTLSMADYLRLDDLYRACELKLCSLVSPNNLMSFAAQPTLSSSVCWGQTSLFHLSPLAQKCRHCMLQHLHNRSLVDVHDPNVHELLSFWFR